MSALTALTEHASDLPRASQVEPPGIPVIIPGEHITAELLDYLRGGVNAGIQLPATADSARDTMRAVSAVAPVLGLVQDCLASG